VAKPERSLVLPTLPCKTLGTRINAAFRGESQWSILSNPNPYAKARRVHLVLDNLNTHFRKCFDDVLGKREATKLLRRVQFHYTPKHSNWLNIAEIEIGILSRQCLDRRFPSRQLLQSEVDAWQQPRNAPERTIEWSPTRQEADRKLGRHYVPKLACCCTSARTGRLRRRAAS
jgi:hypothetical protein